MTRVWFNHEWLLVLTLAVASLTLVACGGGASPQENPAQTAGEPAEQAPEAEHDHDEGHVHVAPHGGLLVEVGDHFANLEFLLDAETGELTMYVLSAHADHPNRIPQELVQLTIEPEGGEAFAMPLDAVEDPLTGETVGDSATFKGSVQNLQGVRSFEGEVQQIMIDEIQFEQIPFVYNADEL